MCDSAILPYILPQNKLVCPDQPYHDDFLETMKKVFIWSRWFGVVGSANNMWKLWGAVLVMLLLVIEIGSVYKLVKLLAGLTAYSTGNRSVTARLAGTIFYTSTLTSLLLSWRLASSWDKLSSQWTSVERKLPMAVLSDGTLKRRMIVVATGMAIFSTLEHVMSILSNIEMDCPPSLLLQQYILTSHAFIIVPTDYSTWLAVPIFFMSNIATILYNYQDLIIILLSMGLTSRYQRLNQCVAKISAFDKNVTKWSPKNIEIHRVYMWRKIREAYVKQAMLVRIVDKSLGGLILLSSLVNFYFICLQLFLGFTEGISSALVKRLYYMVSMAWLCGRFCSVVLAAADVNVHSRRALRYLHSCTAKCYNVEVERLQKQLTKDYVALSGMGFFHLDRSILLQVAGAIVTYELVLIQFDERS